MCFFETNEGGVMGFCYKMCTTATEVFIGHIGHFTIGQNLMYFSTSSKMYFFETNEVGVMGFYYKICTTATEVFIGHIGHFTLAQNCLYFFKFIKNVPF